MRARAVGGGIEGKKAEEGGECIEKGQLRASSSAGAGLGWDGRCQPDMENAVVGTRALEP